MLCANFSTQIRGGKILTAWPILAIDCCVIYNLDTKWACYVPTYRGPHSHTPILACISSSQWILLVKATVQYECIRCYHSFINNRRPIEKKKIQRPTNLNSHPPNAISILFFWGVLKKIYLVHTIMSEREEIKGIKFPEENRWDDNICNLLFGVMILYGSLARLWWPPPLSHRSSILENIKMRD